MSSINCCCLLKTLAKCSLQSAISLPNADPSKRIDPQLEIPMSRSERPNMNASSKVSAKKGRFGGPVRLYRDPLHAFRARGLVISRPREGANGSRIWSVTCPVHSDVFASAYLTRRADNKWEFSCDSCDYQAVKKKLTRISKQINIMIADFYIR